MTCLPARGVAPKTKRPDRSRGAVSYVNKSTKPVIRLSSPKLRIYKLLQLKALADRLSGYDPKKLEKDLPVLGRTTLSTIFAIALRLTPERSST